MPLLAVAGSTGATLVVVLGALVVLLVLVLLALRSALVVVPEYQRAVVLRVGRVVGRPRGPGLLVRVPLLDRVTMVDLRVEVADVPAQDVVTRDDVGARVGAVVWFQVVDPVRTLVGVEDWRLASGRIATAGLRSVVGRHGLHALRARRQDVEGELRTVIAGSTAEWGVDVHHVEIVDVALPGAHRPDVPVEAVRPLRRAGEA